MTKPNKGVAGGAEKSAPLTPAGKYKCPKCPNTITTHVSTYGPPMCTKHSAGAIKMEAKK